MVWDEEERREGVGWGGAGIKKRRWGIKVAEMIGVFDCEGVCLNNTMRAAVKL